MKINRMVSVVAIFLCCTVFCTVAQARYYDPVSGRFLSVDPVLTDSNTGSSFNRYNYANNNPYKYIDPDGRDVTVIVNRNGLGHVGIYVQSADGKVKVLYDPGGSYKQQIKGSGDALEGMDANLKDFVKYQKADGPKVDTFTIKTSNSDDIKIQENIDESGGCMGGLCATCSGNVLRGVGPFSDMGSTFTPWGMASEMRSIKKTEPKPPEKPPEKPKREEK